MTQASPTVGGTDEHSIQHDEDYAAFLAAIKARFAEVTGQAAHLFVAGNRKGMKLFDHFLAALPAADQQVHNCQTCRHFFSHFGNLVALTKKGETRSALWSNYEGPDFYAEAVEILRAAVERESATGVFVENEAVLGTPQTTSEGGFYGGYGTSRYPAGTVFNHLAVPLPSKLRYKGLIDSKKQRAAELREHFRILGDALDHYSFQTANDVLTLLKSKSLYQGQKYVGMAEWFRNMLDQELTTPKKMIRNLRWYAVAGAPTGFALAGGSPFGKTMDELMKGTSLDDIKAKFKSMLDPTKHNRPQKAASNSNLAEAERIVKKLGSAPAFARRYARIEELQPRGVVWAEPTAAPTMHVQSGASASGVFGHLRKGAPARPPLRTEAFGSLVTITLEKFVSKVVPSAESIQIRLAPKSVLGALVTAVDPDAPPIILWDDEDDRNPFSFYTYPEPVYTLGQWGLDHTKWHAVNAITTLPSQWRGQPLNGQTHGALFIIEGARDQASKTAGLGLFPAFMKSEFHRVRRSIEEFSSKGVLEGVDEASAAGFLMLSDVGGVSKNVIRVISDRGRLVIDYQIDRLE
jgi:hypothetical protein